MKLLSKIGVSLGIGVVMFGMAAPALAVPTIITGQNVLQEEVVRDDMYVVGDTVTVNNRVQGDLIVIGGNVIVNAAVTGDLWLVGGSAVVNGAVGDDIRMMGGTLNVNGNVADDVMAVGGEFTIADGATIRGSVWSVAGEMSLYGQINEELTSWLGKGRIDGLVGGDAEIHISEGLSFGNNGKIGESLRYWAPREDPTLVNYAKNVEFNQAVDPNASTRGLIALLTIAGLTAVLWKWLSFLLLGSIIIWLLPKYFPQIIDTMKAQKNTAMYIWNGLLVMIVAPVLAMLFAITVVGIPVASVIFLAYGLLIVFGAIAGAYGIGSYLRQHSHKNQWDQFWNLGLGVLIGIILAYVPIIGWLLQAVVVLYGVGAVLSAKKKLLSEYQK